MIGLPNILVIWLMCFRDISETLQTRFTGCQFIPKLSVSWANNEILQLYASLQPKAAIYLSTPHVVSTLIFLVS